VGACRRRPPVRARRAAGLAASLLILSGAVGCDASAAPPRLVCRALPSLCRVDSAITIDPGERHQRMEGWEVTARAWEIDKATDAFDPSWERSADALFTRLVDDLGIDRLRLEVRSGVENPTDWWQRFVGGEIGYRAYRDRFYESFDDDEDPHGPDVGGFHFGELDYHVETMLLPMRERLARRGERLVVNLCFVDFGETRYHGTLEHAQEPEEYGELIHRTVTHLRDRFGVVPDAIEVILEPDNTTHWRGPAIGRGLVAAARRLEAEGIEPDWIAPSTLSAGEAVPYLDAMQAIDGAPDRLHMLSYHRYRDATPATLAAIDERRRRDGLATGMLEKLGADVDVLIEDLTLAGVSAWQQYGMATRGVDNGFYYLVARETADGRVDVELGERSAPLALVFANVRQGATRIGARSDAPSRRAVAFENVDGRLVVVVRHDDTGGALALSGLRAGRYAVLSLRSGALRPARVEQRVGPDGLLPLVLDGAGTTAVVGLDAVGPPVEAP
jgi:hypothetical protein